MKINSAADLAAILDPAHEVEEWWMFDCPECGASNTNSHYSACFDKPALAWTFTGPGDLHTAREHAWRMEEWLEARDCYWCRKYDREKMINYTYVCQIGKRGIVLWHLTEPNHTSALVAAIEKVSESMGRVC